MARERHPEKWKPQFKVTHIADKEHRCNWCPRSIEKGTEYYQDNMYARYHLECWEEHQKGKDNAYIAARERNHDPVRTLAYWFVTEFLKEKWSWNSHKRYLAEAKFFTNPDKPDPVTGEPQRCFTTEQIKGCLNAMKNGYFGAPILDIRTIHAVTLKNRSGKTFLEDWLEIPALPPTYRTMELQDWINRYGDRAVEQEVMTAGELDMLKAIAFPTQGKGEK